MMLKTTISLFLCLAPLCTGLQAGIPSEAEQRIIQRVQEPGEPVFTPPENWQVMDPNLLPQNIRLLVKAPETNKYPPSINLASDKVSCDLKTYLRKVKAVNEADGIAWRDLGTIETSVGEASLSQIDMDTNWGPVRMMHAIYIQGGKASILTCAALKSDFPQLYDTFFTAMKSLRFNDNWIESVASPQKREELSAACEALREAYQTLCSSEELPINAIFEHPEFQEKHWKPFSQTIQEQFAEMDSNWKEGMLQFAKSHTTASSIVAR